MKLVRIVVLVLLALALIGWVVAGYLLGREAVPETSSYELDLQEVRRVAGALEGARPTHVNEELVAEAELPRVAIFAGESFEAHPMVHRAFQVVFPDRSVVIDAGMSQAMVEAMGGGTFHAEAFARVQQGMARAESIVFTHEHQDHIEGAARGDTAALAGRVRFNAAQLANQAALEAVAMPAALIEASRPIAPGRYVAIAPGVVLIEAAGHTPGSQMVYVGLQDGRELLFLGDVAWHMRQIEELHYRPRLVTDLVLGEDRDQVMAQFRTLHDLAKSGAVRFVVSHDRDQWRALLDDGSIGPRFE